MSVHSESTTRGHRLLLYYNPEVCRRCPLKAQCTSDRRWRRIARWEGEAVLNTMAVRLAANPQMTRLRRNTVEHPFGTIKHAMNQGHFLLKGLRQVRAEFSLSALAYNLLRVMNLVGVKALVETLRRRLRALAEAVRPVHDLGAWFYVRVLASAACRSKTSPRRLRPPGQTAEPAFSHSPSGLTLGGSCV